MPPKPQLPGPLVDSGCSTTIVTDPARIDPASLRLSSTVITGVGSTLRSQGSGTATITLPTASGAAVRLRLPAELIPEAQCDLLSLGAITDNNYVAVLGPSGFPSSLVRSDSPLLTSLHERIAQDTSRIPLLRMPNSTWTLPPATDTHCSGCVYRDSTGRARHFSSLPCSGSPRSGSTQEYRFRS